MKMKLLAPAGDMTAAKTAVNAGADECYIGGLMSARAYTKGFSESEISELLHYAHIRGSRVHVALNTMIAESELEEAASYAKRLYEMGIDALIVSDIGLATVLKSLCPNLPLHASTQMGIADEWGARAAKAMGFCRVIAARETEIENIRKMAATGAEVETFCHGAMCSSVSGACLMSSMIGGRSGNRGRCAQPCRKLYTIGESTAYHLSMKDMCMINELALLKEAGVASVKIEGRMKRPEYVAVVTGEYRRAIDALYEGDASHRDTDALLRIYNRGGFTEGFTFGSRDVTYTKNQSHMGVRVGRLGVKTGRNRAEFIAERGGAVPQKGDGVEFFARESHGGMTLDFAENGMISVTERAQKGDGVYITSDARQLQEAKLVIEKDTRAEAELSLYAAEGKETVLISSSGDAGGRAVGAPTERARKPVDIERIKEQLKKTGGTDFAVSNVTVETEGEPFLPASYLNELRRRAIEELAADVVKKSRKYEAVAGKMPKAAAVERQRQQYIAAEVRTYEQAAGAAAGGADRLYLRFDDIVGDEAERAAELSCAAKKYIVLPPYWSEKDVNVFERGLERFCGIDGVVAGSFSQAAYCRERGIPFIADMWQNAANTYTGAYFGGSFTASAELSAAALSAVGGEAIVYGNIPVMNLVHCPLKTAGKCPGCGKKAMSDDKGYVYGMYREKLDGCVLQVLNPVRTAFPHIEELPFSSGFRLMFFEESGEEARNVTKAYKNGLISGKGAALHGIISCETNSGHIKRGVTDG